MTNKIAQYQIFSDSACDLSTEMRHALNIEYFPMGLIVDGKEYIADLDWKQYSVDEFYSWLKQGRKIKTSLITVEVFVDLIRPYFEKGIDIIYLGCSTALTGSINSFNLAKELLKEEFPDRKMFAPCTYLAAATLGMLVVDAAKEKEKGASIEELAKWVDDHKFFYNQFCTVDTLTYLKEAGRIKGSKAFFGNLFGVKPIFISDRKGNNFVITKAKGTKNSLDMLFDLTKTALEGKNDVVYIYHSSVPERVEILKKRFVEELGVKQIVVGVLGPIIGTTCGPGTIATFCYGKEVTRFDGDGLDEE